MPLNMYTYFVAVVPDEAVQHMHVQLHGAAFDLQENGYDAQNLRKDLSYTYSSPSGFRFENTDYQIKEYARLSRNSNSAVFVLGALYLSVVFVFMSMAILALKTLSSLSEDKPRYNILFRLGATEREQSKTLFWQSFAFFFLPFALPMLLSIPSGIICSHIMQLNGFTPQSGEVAWIAVWIAVVISMIYLLYFTATYRIARRNVIYS